MDLVRRVRYLFLMRYDGPKPTVGDLMALGLRTGLAYCDNPLCNHVSEVPLTRFPPVTIFVALKPRLRCVRCGSRSVSWMPDWTDYQASGRF